MGTALCNAGYKSFMNLKTAVPDKNAPILDYCPSTKDSIPCQWLLKDPYETTTVFCRTSDIEGAGDGLFAAKDLPTNLIISYYNGFHIEPGVLAVKPFFSVSDEEAKSLNLSCLGPKLWTFLGL